MQDGGHLNFYKSLDFSETFLSDVTTRFIYFLFSVEYNCTKKLRAFCGTVTDFLNV
jgi:hypothetical protein